MLLEMSCWHSACIGYTTDKVSQHSSLLHCHGQDSMRCLAAGNIHVLILIDDILQSAHTLHVTPMSLITLVL